ncbi:esterase-like activity of phytase family protein [Aliiruegeria sabulilitoris]|uniref:esterase-like activity of phytase family protein n=1 Tax=Aliiruegeria sabulilitoris TaxID=1510458 RepID=UPI000836CCE3
MNDRFYAIQPSLPKIGANAVTKKIYRIPAAGMVPTPLDGRLKVVSKEELRDLLPDLKQLNGYVQDNVEGLAIDLAGEAFVPTDNDGIDHHSGETLFFSIGKLE